MSDQINTENILEEAKNVVTETVPETTPVVENSEKVDEVANEVVEEKRTKSFFDIFKKDKPAEEAVDTPVAEESNEPTEATEAVDGGAAEAVEGEATEAKADEVPVESAPAKKSLLCGLCASGKKEEAATTEEAAPATEEAAPTTEEGAPATEEAAATTEEAVPVTEETTPVSEEEAPAVAAAATEETAAETTEGEAVAPVEEANVARSGLLYKSGKFFKSNMNERHCRILSTGIFQYSKTEDFTKAHECKINAETTTVAFMAEGEDTLHKYRFELHCCGSVSTYAADTEEDRDEWVRAIETVKESVVPVVVEEAAAPTAETAEEATASE